MPISHATIFPPNNGKSSDKLTIGIPVAFVPPQLHGQMTAYNKVNKDYNDLEMVD